MKDVGQIRSQFPALKRKAMNGKPVIYFDVSVLLKCQIVLIVRITIMYCTTKQTQSGYFETSVNTTEEVARARLALSIFMNCDENEIVLGANATTSIFQFSRALSRNWTSDDEVVVTKLDHFANVSPAEAS